MQDLIAPSILSADFARLGDDVRAVIDAGADVVHFDVMDNHYVPNLTIGPLVLEALKNPDKLGNPGVSAPVDVHLMVKPVDRIIGDFAEAGADFISLHPEACEHPHAALASIRAAGVKAGLVLNPGTPVELLDYLLDLVDLVLVMSVNPGFGGQTFIESSLDKVRAVRVRLDKLDRDVHLEIDGGIKIHNIRAAKDAGADMFVAGSAIFGSDDYTATIKAMRSALA